MVECHLAKVKVASSNLVSRSKKRRTSKGVLLFCRGDGAYCIALAKKVRKLRSNLTRIYKYEKLTYANSSIYIIVILMSIEWSLMVYQKDLTQLRVMFITENFTLTKVRASRLSGQTQMG